MASVFLSAKEVAAIEAAANLLSSEKKSLSSALTGIVVKHDRALARVRTMNYRKFSEIANRELGPGSWSVTSAADVLRILARTEATEEQLTAMLVAVRGERERPWVLTDYLPGLPEFLAKLNRKRTEITGVKATTGTISDL